MYSNDKRIQICFALSQLQKLNVFIHAPRTGRGTNQKKALETEREVVPSLSKAASIQSGRHTWNK